MRMAALALPLLFFVCCTDHGSFFRPEGGVIPPNPPVPHVAMDRSGNGVAISSATASVLEADSTTWRDEPVETGAGEDGDLVMVGSGTAYVGAAGEDELLLLGFELTSGPDPAPTRLRNGPLPLSELRLASNLYGTSGNVYVVWRERIKPDPFTEIVAAFARRKLPGGDWGLPFRLDTNPTQTGPRPQSVFNLRVAVGGDGTAVAVWEQSIETDGVASFAARRTVSGWQAPVMLGSSTEGSSNGMPDVGMDRDGNAIAVYVENDRVYARSLAASTGLWTEPTSLGDTGVPLSPRIAAN
ncbi:MAG: hypothetical protein OER88_11195, partial [Planctomycetota bacterium]|nr:hypothetical protein [Planctomycetota bacterium]